MIRRNLSIRYNFAYALKAIDEPGSRREKVERGDAEHYVVFTVLY